MREIKGYIKHRGCGSLTHRVPSDWTLMSGLLSAGWVTAHWLQLWGEWATHWLQLSLVLKSPIVAALPSRTCLSVCVCSQPTLVKIRCRALSHHTQIKWLTASVLTAVCITRQEQWCRREASGGRRRRRRRRWVVLSKPNCGLFRLSNMLLKNKKK